MFAFAGSRVPPDDLFLWPPSTPVAEKLPGRALSTDKWVIWDGRRANLSFAKTDYWLADTPKVGGPSPAFLSFGDFLHRPTDFWYQSRHWRGIRPLQNATWRCGPLRNRIFARSARRRQNHFLLFGTPFGFTGSPGVFGRLMQAVQFNCRTRDPPNENRNGNEPFTAVFSHACIIHNARVGRRPGIAVRA